MPPGRTWGAPTEPGSADGVFAIRSVGSDPLFAVGALGSRRSVRFFRWVLGWPWVGAVVRSLLVLTARRPRRRALPSCPARASPSQVAVGAGQRLVVRPRVGGGGHRPARLAYSAAELVQGETDRRLDPNRGGARTG